jgi:hypothetical protein
MPGTGLEIDIARNVRAIEWLEAELVYGTGSLLHALIKNNEENALDNMAAIVISTYLLSRRLGHGFARLDAKILARLKSSLEQDHELEQWYGDIAELIQHMRRQ